MLLVIADVFDISLCGMIEFRVLVQSAFSRHKFNQRSSEN